jgi:uncharacterized protein YbjT (DUF2867 family)
MLPTGCPILSDMDAVVDRSGALQHSLRDDLQALQSEAMKALFEACRIDGANRVVQVSAVGIAPDAATAFFRTKAEADAALMASDLSWIILRPGLVIAPMAYGGTALIRGLAPFPSAIPPVNGRQAIRTVDVNDVADAILASVEGRVSDRLTYDVVEGRLHSLQDLVSIFRAWLGRVPAPIFKMPGWLGRGVFKVGDALSYLGWRPPVRTTALLQLDVRAIGDPSGWIR